MAEPAKSPFENLIVGPSGWPEAYHQLQQLIGARGAILFILFAAALLVWWKWEEIVKRPWIKPAIERFKRTAIDKAPAGVLTIAVAHLQDDDGQKQEKLLLDEFKHFDGVETLTVDRAMEWPASGTEQSKKKKAEEEARRLLRQIGADVLIWGSVISLSGKSAMRLYWTPARDVPGAKSTGRYQFQTETLELPIEFWSDLKQILGLLTQPRIAALTVDKPGHYVADKLAPLIAQVRALVQSREGVWNPETLAEMRFSLAVALAVYGDQSGKNEPLVESIELYRKVLEGLGRARVPLDWATTQNNLGNALQRLGERESGTVQFDEAVLAYREALKERTRERAPLQWATTQNNLDTALLRLGERKSDPAKLEGAVEAYGEALQERTRERAPLQWAETQNNLGTALLRLGERENGTARIEGAVIVFHEALQEFTRARVPRQCT